MTAARILIVEDEPVVAMATEMMLKEFGYRVLGNVASGEEAISVLEEGMNPDVILMDIQLAGKLDGIDTARRIKDTRKDVDVIFITAFTDEAMRRRVFETTPLGYLAKPLDYWQLKSLLDEWTTSRTVPYHN